MKHTFPRDVPFCSTAVRSRFVLLTAEPLVGETRVTGPLKNFEGKEVYYSNIQ
jgi:hypothetical protein